MKFIKLLLSISVVCCVFYTDTKAETVVSDTLYMTAVVGEYVEKQFVLQDLQSEDKDISLDYDCDLFQCSMKGSVLTIKFTPEDYGVLQSDLKFIVDDNLIKTSRLMVTTLPALFMITVNDDNYTYLLSGEEKNINSGIAAKQILTSKVVESYYDTVFAWRPELTDDTLEIRTLRGTRLSGAKQTFGLTTGISSMNTEDLGRWTVKPGNGTESVYFVNCKDNTRRLGFRKSTADDRNANLFGNFRNGENDCFEIKPIPYVRKPIISGCSQGENEYLQISVIDNILRIDNINNSSVVSIYDLNGVELYHEELTGNSFEYRLQDNGFYILTIIDGRGKHFRKIIL